MCIPDQWFLHIYLPLILVVFALYCQVFYFILLHFMLWLCILLFAGVIPQFLTLRSYIIHISITNQELHLEVLFMVLHSPHQWEGPSSTNDCVSCMLIILTQIPKILLCFFVGFCFVGTKPRHAINKAFFTFLTDEIDFPTG